MFIMWTIVAVIDYAENDDVDYVDDEYNVVDDIKCIDSDFYFVQHMCSCSMYTRYQHYNVYLFIIIIVPIIISIHTPYYNRTTVY